MSLYDTNSDCQTSDFVTATDYAETTQHWCCTSLASRQFFAVAVQWQGELQGICNHAYLETYTVETSFIDIYRSSIGLVFLSSLSRLVICQRVKKDVIIRLY
jgi:hypothetical protein